MLFECALNVGASAPNPDTRNFSGKVSWNFKSFRQNEIVLFGAEFFGTPFSERKVCSFAYFSYKKSKFYKRYLLYIFIVLKWQSKI